MSNQNIIARTVAALLLALPPVAAHSADSKSKMTEDQWVGYAKALKTRPPMPWFNLNQWTDQDLRAFYQYVKQLGPVGDPAPAYLASTQKPPQPYILWPSPPPAKPDSAKK